jgi:hypothetical protein
MEVEAWINQTISQAMANGQNLRIPTFNGKARKLELVVTNEGGEEISFRYYAENWGEDAGGVDVTVGVGETRSFFFEVNTGKSIGCNYALRLLSDVSLETNVVIYGYFICDRELEGISMLSPAEKRIFKVGESFSCDGLVVKANGEMYDEVVIANFKSSVEEGYVFTSDDVGKRSVTISFGDYSLEYEIEINL